MKTRKFLSLAFFTIVFGGDTFAQKSVMPTGVKLKEFYNKKTSFINILCKSLIFR